MEALKDVFTPFYERLRRPFVGAFWISWIFVNWKLWVGLFYYEETVGGVDKITFIYSHLNFNTLVVTPASCAALFLLVMPLADLGAFSWQEYIRKQKTKIKYCFDSKSFVPAETHLQVVKDKDGLKTELVNLESKYQQIESHAQRYKEDSLAHKFNMLEVSRAYFQGSWYCLNNDIPGLRITFTENIVYLSNKNFTGDSKTELFVIDVFLHKNRSLFILLQTPIKKNDSYFIEMWRELFNGLSHDVNTCVLRGVSYIEIPFSALYKNDFTLKFNGRSPEITLEREDDFNPVNQLFSNDSEKVYKIEDRIRPSKANRLFKFI
jgi:hypothetical protein